MKKIILIIFYSFIITFFLKSQPLNQYGWQWLNPQPTNNNLYKIKFIDLNTGYAIGDNSTIIKSTNGGINWTFQLTWDNSTILKMLYVFNKDTIITGGYWGMMYKTENGGLNWIKINIGTNGFLYGMSFINSITGYLVSETGLFKTTNSGNSWSALSVFPGISKSDIYFPDQNTGYIVGQKLIKTTNSGASWDTLSITKFPGQKIYFINNQTGFIGGNNYIFRTTTGGINWDTVLTGAALIQQIDFINSSTGWASTNMYFYKTTDVGATWFNLNVTNGAAAFNFLNTQTGYLCNYSSIISKTTNGGLNWSSIGRNIVNYDGIIGCIYFLNENTGFLSCGTPTQFLKTTNSGINWTTLPNAGGPNSIRFFNENTGFAAFGGVSGTGTIKKTINGGLNWASVQTPHAVYYLFFSDISTGFGVESRGICRTSDAGQSWQEVMSVSDWVNSVFFVNSYTGFAVGTYLYKSTNSGLNWVTMSSNFIGSGQSVYFINANTGYIASGNSGYGGVVSKTTDGGNYWVLQDAGINYALTNIQFFNENSGIASGYNGKFISTTNGGLNWREHYFITNSNFYGMQFFDMNTGYLCGSGGILLKTSNGGSILNTRIILSEIPKKFILSQNYPNPFNPTTKIKFSLPILSEGGATDVKLIIYDALGREVQTLVNEQLQPGTYEIDFNGSNLPSGVYYYKLEVSDPSTPLRVTETRKMVLIK